MQISHPRVFFICLNSIVCLDCSGLEGNMQACIQFQNSLHADFLVHPQPTRRHMTLHLSFLTAADDRELWIGR